MNVVFRVDSSAVIGTGHVVRCEALARELKARHHSVLFICRELHANIIESLENNGYEVLRLPSSASNELPHLDNHKHSRWLTVSQKDDLRDTVRAISSHGMADWVIIDHYSLDCEWESEIRAFARRILVVDDLADRPHDCDVLVDQNLFKNPSERYENVVGKQCATLLGPSFALLRPEFAAIRPHVARIRRSNGQRVFVFFGGVDATNVTGRVLEVIRRSQLHLDVAIGVKNPFKNSLQDLCATIEDCRLFIGSKNIAELMAGACCALGASGSATWERCCVGLPSIVVSIAENQRAIGEELGRIGAAHYVGDAHQLAATKIVDALMHILADPTRMKRMSEVSWELVDGLGVNRVISCMER